MIGTCNCLSNYLPSRAHARIIQRDEDSDDEYGVGPLPPSASTEAMGFAETIRRFEQRSDKMKKTLTAPEGAQT